MFLLFRKIRNTILKNQSPNETGKKVSTYLLYAFGEIILVMIGILAAIQVDNWNEGNKKKSSEMTLLHDLKEEFFSRKELLEEYQIQHKKSLEQLKVFADLLFKKPELITTEQLDSLMLYVYYTPEFDPAYGVMNSAINSGGLELLQNKLLRYKIVGIEEHILDYIQSVNAVRAYVFNASIPYLNSKYPVKSITGETPAVKFGGNSRFKTHSKQFLYELEFENILEIRKILANDLVESTIRLLDAKEQVISMLEVELNKK